MRQALGRGLDALIPQKSKEEDGKRLSSKISLEKIRPNHLQPRKIFDPESLSELAASIKEHGLAQPILVSYDQPSDSYELIAGERRFRAATLAGLKEIDAVIRNPETEKERLTLALIENLQREDLNAIDTALGYVRLMKEAAITQTDLGRLLGKSKSAISNTLRLLDLPEEMQRAVQQGLISEGHARALLMIENPIEKKRIFSMALEQKLSVRALEDLARAAAGVSELQMEEEPQKRAARYDLSADVRALQESLARLLGTKIELKAKKNSSGRIVIHYFSAEDFDRILNIIKK